ncbi:MAG: preprotein translocase subunit SecG [Bacteroidales bacterium]|nr:preprotein translocase subunit SecG [Bacteroidales bacterium]
MYNLISVLVVIVCVFLVLIVLVQNSKGGGLASNFQSSNQFMGVRKTTDFLEKSTWILAITLMAFSVVGSLTIPRGEENRRSVIEDQIDNVVDPNAIPTFPTTVPEPGGSPTNDPQ